MVQGTTCGTKGGGADWERGDEEDGVTPTCSGAGGEHVGRGECPWVRGGTGGAGTRRSPGGSRGALDVMSDSASGDHDADATDGGRLSPPASLQWMSDDTDATPALPGRPRTLGTPGAHRKDGAVRPDALARRCDDVDAGPRAMWHAHRRELPQSPGRRRRPWWMRVQWQRWPGPPFRQARGVGLRWRGRRGRGRTPAGQPGRPRGGWVGSLR